MTFVAILFYVLCAFAILLLFSGAIAIAVFTILLIVHAVKKYKNTVKEGEKEEDTEEATEETAEETAEETVEETVEETESPADEESIRSETNEDTTA